MMGFWRKLLAMDATEDRNEIDSSSISTITPLPQESAGDLVASIFAHSEGGAKSEEAVARLITTGDSGIPEIRAALLLCADGSSPAPYWWKSARLLIEVLRGIGSEWAKIALLEVVQRDSRIGEWDQVRGAAAAAIGTLGDTKLAPGLAAAINEPHAPALAIQEALRALGVTSESPSAIIQKGDFLDPASAVEFFAANAHTVATWTNDEQRAFYYTWAGKVRVLKGEESALPYYAAALAADPDPMILAWQRFPGVSPSPEAASELAAKYPIAAPEKPSTSIGQSRVPDAPSEIATVPESTGRGELAPRRLIELVAELGGKHGSDARIQAAKLLREAGAPAVPLLVKSLESPDWNVRWWAASILGNIGDTAATQALIIALGDPDAEVRHYAAEALGKLGDPCAIEPLITALGDPGNYVQQAAAEALGRLRDSRAAEPLRTAAQQAPKDFVREAAIEALKQIGS